MIEYMFANKYTHERKQKMKNTPYDDVFRTLLNDCSSLIIPVINEAFGEHYTGKEKIVFLPNEHFLNQQDGAEEERITDSCFRILAQKPKKYHCECQSNDDDSMLVRFFDNAEKVLFLPSLIVVSCLAEHVHYIIHCQCKNTN